jgi:hypothetical protein
MNSVKKVAMLAVIFVVAFCSQSAFAAEGQIEEMPAGWARNAVQNAVERGFLTSYGGKIYPDRALTRAEMAAIVNRLFGAEAKASLSSFTDVPASSWYAADMAKAVQMKSFQGSGGKLAPEKNITRQEAFVVLSRIMEISGGAEAELKAFQDGDSVAASAKGSTAAMVDAGYVTGSNGKLRPSEMITRAKFAQLMYQIANDRVDRPGEYSQSYNGNLFVSVPEVTLKNAVIAGDLILCDGIGSGDIKLDHVTVEGRIVVRGGGKDTVALIASKINGDMVINNVNNPVHILASEGTKLNNVIVQNQAILDAPISLLRLNGKADVTVQSGAITSMEVKGGADGSRVTVGHGASIGSAVIEAANTALQGKGQITQVQARGNDLIVNTPGTKVIVDQGIKGVKAGGVVIEAGKSAIIDKSGIGAVVSGSVSGTGSGGSKGGGGSGGNVEPKPDPGTSTDKNWVDISKTGIVHVEFVSYATVALRLDAMSTRQPSEYAYYIEGVKQSSDNISKVMNSADGSLLAIKIMLPNNAESQTLKLVKGTEYMLIKLKDIGYSEKE